MTRIRRRSRPRRPGSSPACRSRRRPGLQVSGGASPARACWPAMTTGRMIGLVGGLGVGATNHYYREIVAAHQAHDATPQLLIAHADVQRVFTFVAQDDRAGLAGYLTGLLESLAAGGAAGAANGAGTPRLCTAGVCAPSPPAGGALVAGRGRAEAGRGA